jgi:pyrroloquinoline quinone (PQQ) biosynthesis protein C
MELKGNRMAKAADTGLMIGRSEGWHRTLQRFDWAREEPYDPQEFLEFCHEAIFAGFYGTRHPLALRWIEGELTADELRFMATQEYWYFRCTVWWNAGKVLHCPVLEDQRSLLGPLMEEAGVEEQAHEELFLRYLRGLGLSRNTVLGEGALPRPWPAWRSSTI